MAIQDDAGSQLHGICSNGQAKQVLFVQSICNIFQNATAENAAIMQVFLEVSKSVHRIFITFN